MRTTSNFNVRLNVPMQQLLIGAVATLDALLSWQSMCSCLSSYFCSLIANEQYTKNEEDITLTHNSIP